MAPDGQDIASLVVFCAVIVAVIVLVLKPAQYKWRGSWHTFTASYSLAPVVGVILLLACRSIDLPVVGNGIAGDERIQPYGIVILFMALAYIACSLDVTGAFAYLALKITYASGGRGPLLFVLYYLLSAVVTALTSNDVSILTLTPIVLYFSMATRTDPTPFLVAEFTAANIWSQMLFISNPTNLIVSQAEGLSFIEFAQWMILPTIAAGAACIALLYIIYGRHVPRQLNLPVLNPAMFLSDRLGALFGATVLLGCLVLLAVAPELGWELWLVALLCAVVHAMYNFVKMVAVQRWRGARSSLDGRSQQEQELAKQESVCEQSDEDIANSILKDQKVAPGSDGQPLEICIPSFNANAMGSGGLAATVMDSRATSLRGSLPQSLEICASGGKGAEAIGTRASAGAAAAAAAAGSGSTDTGWKGSFCSGRGEVAARSEAGGGVCSGTLQSQGSCSHHADLGAAGLTAAGSGQLLPNDEHAAAQAAALQQVLQEQQQLQLLQQQAQAAKPGQQHGEAGATKPSTIGPTSAMGSAHRSNAPASAVSAVGTAVNPVQLAISHTQPRMTVDNGTPVHSTAYSNNGVAARAHDSGSVTKQAPPGDNHVPQKGGYKSLLSRGLQAMECAVFPHSSNSTRRNSLSDLQLHALTPAAACAAAVSGSDKADLGPPPSYEEACTVCPRADSLPLLSLAGQPGPSAVALEAVSPSLQRQSCGQHMVGRISRRNTYSSLQIASVGTTEGLSRQRSSESLLGGGHEGSGGDGDLQEHRPHRFLRSLFQLSPAHSAPPGVLAAAAASITHGSDVLDQLSGGAKLQGAGSGGLKLVSATAHYSRSTGGVSGLKSSGSGGTRVVSPPGRGKVRRASNFWSSPKDNEVEVGSVAEQRPLFANNGRSSLRQRQSQEQQDSLLQVPQHSQRSTQAAHDVAGTQVEAGLGQEDGLLLLQRSHPHRMSPKEQQQQAEHTLSLQQQHTQQQLQLHHRGVRRHSLQPQHLTSSGTAAATAKVRHVMTLQEWESKIGLHHSTQPPNAHPVSSRDAVCVDISPLDSSSGLDSHGSHCNVSVVAGVKDTELLTHMHANGGGTNPGFLSNATRRRSGFSDSGKKRNSGQDDAVAELDEGQAEYLRDLEAGEVDVVDAARSSRTEAAIARKLQPKRARFLDTFWVLPWDIVPFVFGMFVLVEALSVHGWVETLAGWLARSSDTTAKAIFLMGGVSIVLSNLINNQPMTILLTRVCLDPGFNRLVSPKAKEGALFALVVGSNLGANFTLTSSLAGIMWVGILRKMGTHIGYGRFIQLMLPVGILTSGIALLVVWFEIVMFP